MNSSTIFNQILNSIFLEFECRRPWNLAVDYITNKTKPKHRTLLTLRQMGCRKWDKEKAGSGNGV